MRSAAAGAAVLSVGLLLSACGGGDDGPDVLPPITATPSVTSAAPSAFPETAQGAAAFVRAFFDELNTAYRTADPDLLRPYLATNCEVCGRYLSSLERLRDGQVTVETDGIDLVSAESPGREGGLFTVSVVTRSTGVIFRSGDGTVTGQEPAGIQNGEIRLRRSGSTWQLVEYVLFQEPS